MNEIETRVLLSAYVDEMEKISGVPSHFGGALSKWEAAPVGAEANQAIMSVPRVLRGRMSAVLHGHLGGAEMARLQKGETPEAIEQFRNQLKRRGAALKSDTGPFSSVIQRIARSEGIDV